VLGSLVVTGAILLLVYALIRAVGDRVIRFWRRSRGVCPWRTRLVSSAIMARCLSDLGVLFPHLADVIVDRVERTDDLLRLVARVRAADACCPRCGTVSARVHGRYRRRLVDAAFAGSRVVG
jgi:hypothetical protein